MQEDKFVRVNIKLPKKLHDKYVELADEYGIAKSALMVLDMKSSRDTQDVISSMKKENN